MYSACQSHDFMISELALPEQLRLAIARKTLEVSYQPVIRLADNKCVGVESLLRWRLHGQEISPELFVGVAEQHRLMGPLTDLVLHKSLDDLACVLSADRSFRVSINVGSDDLRSVRFLDVLAQALKWTGVRASQVGIEATERGFMHPDATRSVIAALRWAGHPVYIDDFGTGYSCLSYLGTFHVDALKLDKAFVNPVENAHASCVVAPHIIAMAHDLGMEIVAEGIESAAQAEYLLRKGVQYGQGWYFAKAMPVAELLPWLAQHAQSGKRDERRRCASSPRLQLLRAP
ncbi:EAL domain-containing protein [Paraburkholderia hospita]|nr:EAL domain-containing protein [Paraburkholderia hospita]